MSAGTEAARAKKNREIKKGVFQTLGRKFQVGMRDQQCQIADTSIKLETNIWLSNLEIIGKLSVSDFKQ